MSTATGVLVHLTAVCDLGLDLHILPAEVSNAYLACLQEETHLNRKHADIAREEALVRQQPGEPPLLCLLHARHKSTLTCTCHGYLSSRLSRSPA